MQVSIESAFSDAHLDARQQSNQRQLSLAISATEQTDLPLNLCLVLNRSSSAQQSLESVQRAVIAIIERLQPSDRLSVVAFDKQAEIIVKDRLVGDASEIVRQINLTMADKDGETAIAEAILLGIKQVAKSNPNHVSRIFLVTYDDDRHINNQRCLKLARLASEYKITIDTVGVGEGWDRNLLEQIADITRGTLTYIDIARSDSLAELEQLSIRARSVGLSDAYLNVELMPKVRLAEFKPVAQVAPETIELPIKLDGNCFDLHLGDLYCDRPRVILINIYIDKLSPGTYQILSLRLRYDNLTSGRKHVYSNLIPIAIESQARYQPAASQSVRSSILTLARYRQIQIAEAKLEREDLLGASSMLHAAAQTSLRLGDKLGARVLESNASCLMQRKELSLGDRQHNLMVAKKVESRK